MSGRAGHFADRLLDAADRAGSPVCVGLDPVFERLPERVRSARGGEADAVESFCMTVVDAVTGVVPAVKVQSACFEALGAEGFAAMQRVCGHARAAGMVVILDAKRGDIGMTAERYAQFAFGQMDADALTVNPFLGADTLAPYLDGAKWPGRGAFALVRTSNPGSDGVQGRRLEDGRTVAQMLADHVVTAGEGAIGSRGMSALGAVVAATKPADAKALRARMPRQVLLVPGYGAQGGTPESVRELLLPGAKTPGGAGALITASRSVIYAYAEGASARGGADWPGAVRSAAEAFAAEVRTLLER